MSLVPEQITHYSPAALLLLCCSIRLRWYCITQLKERTQWSKCFQLSPLYPWKSTESTTVLMPLKPSCCFIPRTSCINLQCRVNSELALNTRVILQSVITNCQWKSSLMDVFCDNRNRLCAAAHTGMSDWHFQLFHLVVCTHKLLFLLLFL